jgi:hypothetical protein
VVIGYALPAVPDPAVGHLQDILMMALLGGRERTLEEYRELIEPAGTPSPERSPLGAAATGPAAPWRVLQFRRD